MHRRRAFTLVELLVVIALIGVLAALLLSALSSAVLSIALIVVSQSGVPWAFTRSWACSLSHEYCNNSPFF